MDKIHDLVIEFRKKRQTIRAAELKLRDAFSDLPDLPGCVDSSLDILANKRKGLKTDLVKTLYAMDKSELVIKTLVDLL